MITCQPFWTKESGRRMGPLLSETRCCSLVMLETTPLHYDTSPSSAPVAVCKYKYDVSTTKWNNLEKCIHTHTSTDRWRQALLPHLINSSNQHLLLPWTLQ
jgi:hypothetical protein